MIQFIIKRLTYGIFVLFGVTITVFFIFNALPGDPVAMMAGQRADVSSREMITRELGLDKPLSVQLAYYLNDISPISVHKNTTKNEQEYEYSKILAFSESVLVVKTPYLRRSFQSDKKVIEIISESIVGTMWLALASMTIATFFGITFGIISSLNQGKWLDHTILAVSVFGISAPSFVAAILISMTFGYYFADITGLNMAGPLWVNNGDGLGTQLVLRNIILPAITLGIRPLAIITQLTRSSMLDVLSQDYIRTAKAKGLSKYNVIVKHALKNALNPVITAVSGWFASLMAGAFIIEFIFNWNGIGSVTINAVNDLDFPIVMGSTIFVAFIFILVNIVVDILYRVIDPRVKLQ